ncbi:uncharacterized protein LOC118761791 [Octopus sinensis]|uniref:Uncharacterized protein LOC118761791 n=1 Tax=Octopus sinensis TaxID=2607531 RepID=A0A7E6EJR1_9MOLL|nr:uncharacterized protein LOC118761791 [Octopus sinensis]
MNLKGIQTSIQYHLLLILLSELTLLHFATPKAGKPACINVRFAEITKSKCLSARNTTYGTVSSANDIVSSANDHVSSANDHVPSAKDTVSSANDAVSSDNDCASRCTSHSECGYFSYCDGSCHIHQWFYDEEIKDYDCHCSSYILLSGNGTDWQKVFKMTKNSFERSPLYLYWDKLPIKKVRFRARKEYEKDDFITFNGKGTNSTSWFQKDKIIENSNENWVPRKFTFIEKDPYFRIEMKVGTGEKRFIAARKKGTHEEFDISIKNEDEKSVFRKYNALIISVILM